MRPRQRPIAWPGLLLVLLGGGLLAREFGYLPPTVRVIDFWPLILVSVGTAGLFCPRGFVAALFSVGFLALGAVLLAANLGFLALPAGHLWPVLLVLVGVAILLGGRHQRDDPNWIARRKLQRARWRWRDTTPRGPGQPGDMRPHGAGQPGDRGNPFEHQHPHFNAQTVGDERLMKQITFSGAQYKIESQAWRGGELGVLMGGVELDLRYATLHPAGAVLDVRVVLGGVDIRVPDTWQVISEVTPFFGSADDVSRSTQGATTAPRLKVIGSVTFGGVSIRN